MKLSLVVLLFALVALATARKSRRDSSVSSDSSGSSEKRGKGNLSAKLDSVIAVIKDRNVAREDEWRPNRNPLVDSIRWSLKPRQDEIYYSVDGRPTRLDGRWSWGRQDALRPARPILQQVSAWNLAQSPELAWADAVNQAKAEAQLNAQQALLQAQIAPAQGRPGRPGRPGKGRRPGQVTVQASVQSTDVSQGWADAAAEAQLQAQQAQLQAQYQAQLQAELQAKLDAERAQAQAQQQQVQAQVVQVAQALNKPSKSNSGESGSGED